MIQENSNVSKFKEWWSGLSKKQKWIIVIAVLFVLGLMGGGSSGSNCGCSDRQLGETAKQMGISYEEARKMCCEMEEYLNKK